MSRVRRCDARCHSAKGSVCSCWCGGTFHGSAGGVNRQALLEIASDPVALKQALEQHGFKNGLTKYIDKLKLLKEEVKNGRQDNKETGREGKERERGQ